jgi:hypothetical protein
MPLSMDKPIAIPVELVCAAGPVPFMGRGTIRRFTQGHYTIELEEPALSLAPRMKVILNFEESENPRAIVVVESVEGCTLKARQMTLKPRERRDFPRVLGGVPLRFRMLEAHERVHQIARWIAGDAEPLEQGQWIRPDENVDFSVTGLCFDTAWPCEEGDVLLVELGMRGRYKRWNVVAEVARVDPVPEDEVLEQEDGARPTHRIAIRFQHIPDAARQALSDLTLYVQQALI